MRAKTIRKTVLALSSAVLVVSLGSATAQEAEKPEAATDAVFAAIDAELERARVLKMEGLDRPYFLGAYVNDNENFSVSATFGALRSRGGGKSQSISINVRVGTPDLDNTNYSTFSFGGMGGGGSIPTEADTDALRQSLWLEFDSEYKSAAQAIAKKRAYLAANTVKERLPDFGEAPLSDVILPREKLEVDRDKWTDIVRRVSAVFRDYDYVYGCSVNMTATMAHQYFVSTDPTRHRFAFPHCNISITARTQCADGMDVSTTYTKMTRSPSDLPGEEDLLAAAHEVAKRLGALKDAPTADDYWGPVLFTGDAAAGFFLKTIADPLSHARQDLGSSSGGRLVDRMGRRIASKMLTVRDDPTLLDWNGEPLLGHYPVDDDGVKPQVITLLDKGFLRTHYTSRVPTKHVKTSNGHSRAGEGSTGNLIVEAAETLSRADLEKKLIELVEGEDLEYGLVVEQFAGTGGFSFSFGSSTGVRFGRPSVVYKLYRDGRREMVRGAAFLPASFRVLRDIVALGDDARVVNTRQFGQLVSVVAPSVLVEELELRRPSEEFSKPPYSERPEMATGK